MRQVKSNGEKCKHVLISTIDGVQASFPIDETMKECSIYWCKRLDSRQRLSEADREAMRIDSVERFEKRFHLDHEIIKSMSRKGIIQVTFPIADDELSTDPSEVSLLDHALLLPWEYVLSAITKQWVLGSEDFELISSLVFSGALIPLETVCLTEYKLFGYAKGYGVDYFLNEDGAMRTSGEDLHVSSSMYDGNHVGDFESFLDIVSARKFLQPLPMS